MRYKITFSKTEAMRFTGHLDLHKTLARTMRRANLPLEYSQGFNARPKIQLASALPLGYTSEMEMAEFWLEEDLPAKQVAEAIVKASPPGIILHATETPPEKGPLLQNALTSAHFEITLRAPVEDLEGVVQDLRETDSLPREKFRKGKRRTYDLKDFILDVQVLPPDENSKQRLAFHLTAQPGATGRPDEILEAMGLDPLAARIHRTELVFEES